VLEWKWVRFLSLGVFLVNKDKRKDDARSVDGLGCDGWIKR
jgi:hypothetical protein